MYLTALALQAKGDRAAAVAMAKKAADYNSINNANYAYVRRDAQRFLQRARAAKSGAEVASDKGG
jgi:hypothetical protein